MQGIISTACGGRCVPQIQSALSKEILPSESSAAAISTGCYPLSPRAKGAETNGWQKKQASQAKSCRECSQPLLLFFAVNSGLGVCPFIVCKAQPCNLQVEVVRLSEPAICEAWPSVALCGCSSGEDCPYKGKGSRLGRKASPPCMYSCLVVSFCLHTGTPSFLYKIPLLKPFTSLAALTS